MKHESTFTLNAATNWQDVITWAEENGEKRDTIYELKKVPARLGLLDDEASLIPADLAHFEKVIAVSPYGAVSNASDLDKARKRGNSRLRNALRRFHAGHDGGLQRDDIRESYSAAIDMIRALEGFADDGAPFSTSTHKPLVMLRARANCRLADLDQSEFDRLWSDATADERKSLRKAQDRIADIKRKHNQLPELAAMMPKTELHIPASPDRARRIVWTTLPEGFRCDAEAVFQKSLRKASDLKAWAKEQLQLDRSAVEIDAEVAAARAKKNRRPKNDASAIAGYKQAITWLCREHPDGTDVLRDVRSLYTTDLIEAACVAQIERSKKSATLKDADESSTLWTRMTNLTTVARHGLKNDEAVAAVNVVRLIYDDYILSPKQMTADVKVVMDRLRKSPGLAARHVNSPSTLAKMAKERLGAPDENGDWTEDQALRLFAAAVARAIQVSRPLRPRNLFLTRVMATNDCPRNINWIRDKKHAEIRFAGAEVKNGQAITVPIVGSDVEILWAWQHVYRARFMELRKLPDSPYLFPGLATPRLQKGYLPLPHGCMSVAAQAGLWDLGERQVGLGLTPHQCRHATATLYLAVRPGDFATVASVLGNTEKVARDHYGLDSGERAARAVRDMLLTEHPDIFKRMKGAF